MADVRVVGLMSTWREGALSQLAYATLTGAGLDEVIVCEGLAGPEPRDAGLMPATECPITFTLDCATDAEKLTAIVKYARGRHPDGPLWGVWLSGDELLANGSMIRDYLQRVQWEDERLGRSLLKPDNGPSFSMPLTQVEHDGSLGRVMCRMVRLDLIRRYVVSSHVIELVTGARIQHGSRPLVLSDLPQMMALEEAERLNRPELVEEISGRVFVPPMFTEPYVLHRPHLRHPARQAVRMYEQEAEQLHALGLPA